MFCINVTRYFSSINEAVPGDRFLLHNIVKHSICYDNVGPSVCLCLTLVSHTQMVPRYWNMLRIILQNDISILFLVSSSQILQSWISGFIHNECVKHRHPPVNKAKNLTNIPWYLRNSARQTRKSHAGIQVILKVVTLNDLKSRKWSLFCVISPKPVAFGANYVKLT